MRKLIEAHRKKEPTLADLKESGSIEEDSDNVIMLHQTDEGVGDLIDMSILIRKQRNGERDVCIESFYNKKKICVQVKRKKLNTKKKKRKLIGLSSKEYEETIKKMVQRKQLLKED